MKTRTPLKIMTKKTALFLFVSLLTLSSCSKPEKELDNFLSQKEKQYEQIAIKLGTAYWNYYSAEAEVDLKAPKKEFYNLLINDTLNNFISEWYPKLNTIKDTILKTRVNKWHNVLLAARVEYNAEIMELRSELEEMFEVSNDKDKESYDYEKNILKLIELRNKKAVELGFKNYVHLTMQINGIGYDWFLKFVEETDKATLNAYKKLVEKYKKENKQDKFNFSGVYPFIGKYYSNNTPSKLKEEDNIKIVKTSLANIGVNYDELPAKLVEMELPAGIGGQGIMVDIPNDFRAVMTLGMDISVWMHEMGHGLHGLFNSINSPVLEGYEWVPGNANPAFAEGMAEVNAGFCRNSEWQKKYTNLTDDEIKEKKQIVNENAPAYIRYHLYKFMKETELYLQPGRPYQEVHEELAKKYFLVDEFNKENASIKNIIYVTYPLYLQNYLLADMVSKQVHSALEKKFGKDYAFNKDIANYLAKHFYSKGEYYSWNERLKKGTGNPLDLNAYFKAYNIKK